MSSMNSAARSIIPPSVRKTRRKPVPYIDIRPQWPLADHEMEKAETAKYEMCDAIARNNHSQAMHALGIKVWEDDGNIVEFDPVQARLLNPNLIDVEAPYAWEYFRRELSRRSLLHEAIAYSSGMVGRNNDPTIVKMLLAKSALASIIDDSGHSPLHVAAYTNNANAAVALIAAGADVNLRSRRGKTPLHTAAYNDSAEVCQILLAAGADPTIKNSRYETPATMAENLSSESTRATLLAAFARQKMINAMEEALSNRPKPSSIDEDPELKPSSRITP